MQGETAEADYMGLFLPEEEMGALPTANTLTVDGVTYEFVGPPFLRRNPRTQVDSHWEAKLKVAV